MNSSQLANLNRFKKLLDEMAESSGGVTQSYVDSQDAETLSDAKSYTDTAVTGLPSEALTNTEIEALLT